MQFSAITSGKLNRQTGFLIGVKKSRAERMDEKLSTYVANQRGPFFYSTWAYDIILEKREKKGHIFVRDQ